MPFPSARRRSGTGLFGDGSSSGRRSANHEHAKPCVGGWRVSPPTSGRRIGPVSLHFRPWHNRAHVPRQATGKGRAYTAHTTPYQEIYRSFLEIQTHTSAMRRENRSKSLTALGKKLSKNFQIIAPLREHSVDAVSRPARGAAGLDGLAAGLDEHAGEVETADDRLEPHSTRPDVTWR